MIEPSNTTIEPRDPAPRLRVAAAPARVPAKPVRQFSTSIDPDKDPLHRLDPVLNRKGGATAHKGVLFMVAGGVFAMAYAFNVGGLGTYLDQVFTNVDKSAQSQNSFVVSTIISIAPFVGAALLALLLYALLRWVWGGVKSASKGRRLSQRHEVGLSEFIKMAEAEGVGAKVAREAYALLKPAYHGRMRVLFSDTLRGDLHLSAHDVVDLYAGCLRKSDRHLRSVETELQPATVLELLMMVEKAPVRSAAKEPPRLKTGVRGRSLIRPAFKEHRAPVSSPTQPS